MSGIRKFPVLLCILAALSALVPSAGVQETREAQRAQRCAYYRELVQVALENVNRSDMTPDFVAGHDAFIAGGCFAGKAVCPRTPAELAFADILTMMTVSANMGSTFTPFRCPVQNAG